MRNCFVPGCDAFCRKNNLTARKMFLPPKKLFDDWSKKLPNKRALKPHDRVCERHFDEEMIIKYWETNVNGIKHLTPRDKPKLRENAIPNQNLPSKAEQFESSDSKSLKEEIITQTIIAAASKRKMKDKLEVRSPKKVKVDEVVEIEVMKEDEQFKEDDEVQTKDEKNDPEEIAAKLALFEIIYDEAFDVTLPSLLWGIHRDPERKFLAFSEFDNSSMSTSKLLHISDNFICKTFVNGSLTHSSTQTLRSNNLTADGISALLDDLDKISL